MDNFAHLNFWFQAIRSEMVVDLLQYFLADAIRVLRPQIPNLHHLQTSYSNLLCYSNQKGTDDEKILASHLTVSPFPRRHRPDDSAIISQLIVRASDQVDKLTFLRRRSFEVSGGHLLTVAFPFFRKMPFICESNLILYLLTLRLAEILKLAPIRPTNSAVESKVLAADKERRRFFIVYESCVNFQIWCVI